MVFNERLRVRRHEEEQSLVVCTKRKVGPATEETRQVGVGLGRKKWLRMSRNSRVGFITEEDLRIKLRVYPHYWEKSLGNLKTWEDNVFITCYNLNRPIQRMTWFLMNLLLNTECKVLVREIRVPGSRHGPCIIYNLCIHTLGCLCRRQSDVPKLRYRSYPVPPSKFLNPTGPDHEIPDFHPSSGLKSGSRDPRLPPEFGIGVGVTMEYRRRLRWVLCHLRDYVFKFLSKARLCG